MQVFFIQKERSEKVVLLIFLQVNGEQIIVVVSIKISKQRSIEHFLTISVGQFMCVLRATDCFDVILCSKSCVQSLDFDFFFLY